MNNYSENMTYFKNDKDFQKSLNRYNVLLGNLPIRSSVARSERLDIFDKVIKKGDTFYKRDVGNIELTKSSLDKVLYIALSFNENFVKNLDQAIDKQMQDITNKMW